MIIEKWHFRQHDKQASYRSKFNVKNWREI